MPASKHTQKIWEICAKKGPPKTELEKKMETLRDELRPHTSKWQFIVHHVTQWKATRNPHYMDFAFQLCVKYQVPIQGVIQEEIHNASVMRTNGTPSGTADKIVKDGILDMALTHVLNFRYYGLTLEDAAEKAAVIFAPHFINQSFKPYKASYIQRRYVECYRQKENEEHLSFDETASEQRTQVIKTHTAKSNHNSGFFEDRVFENWSKEPAPFNGNRAIWEKIIATTPDCPDDLKGTRR